jgi:SAM-dependent methyltransferase
MQMQKISHIAQTRRKLQSVLGYDFTNWLRIKQIESWRNFFRRQDVIGDILEISPGWNGTWRSIPCKSYSSCDYPDFDIARETLPRQFDYVIADQVLEHVLDADAAMKNIYAMVKPGGYALIATPFLFRVHARPHDFRRWTEAGLRHLLQNGGFADQDIESFSWGNKKCARAHIGGPVRSYGWGRDLSNDPEYPIMVWAFAKR